MRLFVAGATGAIGRALLPLLSAHGHEVTGTTRSPAKAGLIEALGGSPAVIDVYERDRLLAVVREARPDVILHLLTDLSGADMSGNARLRIEGTRNLVDAAVGAGVSRL